MLWSRSSHMLWVWLLSKRLHRWHSMRPLRLAMSWDKDESEESCYSTDNWLCACVQDLTKPRWCVVWPLLLMVYFINRTPGNRFVRKQQVIIVVWTMFFVRFRNMARSTRWRAVWRSRDKSRKWGWSKVNVTVRPCKQVIRALDNSSFCFPRAWSFGDYNSSR